MGKYEEVVQLFINIQRALTLNENLPNMCFKPQQIQCWSHLICGGKDVVAVLPTGYGKSIIFQLLPSITPEKHSASSSKPNIVVVVGPLNSIMADQMMFLKEVGISCGAVPYTSNEQLINYQLFPNKSTTKTSMIDEEGEEDIDFSMENLLEDSDEEVGETELDELPSNVVEGKCSIVFGHPEAFLSPLGRKLLCSEVYQNSVVAITIDEAHCVETWKDFRVDFGRLVAIRALLPHARLLALTATAAPAVLRTLKRELEIPHAEIVKVSPNRSNIFLQRVFRSAKDEESYQSILKSIAKELSRLGEEYPLTIVYAKMVCISKVFRIFNKVVPDSNTDGLRRFALFHRETETKVKDLVISELGKDQCYIRVVVATQALGMGVNAKHVQKVIHITPSSSLESYFQEVGRAGRDGEKAVATLHYNNSDIASNRTNLTAEMKNYCREEGCLRSFILNYFGFPAVKQERCCSNCHPEDAESEEIQIEEQPLYRSPPSDQHKFRMEVTEVVKEFNFYVSNTDVAFAPTEPLDEKSISQIIDNAQYVKKKSYFIQFGIWNDDYLSALYGVVCKFCAAL